MKRQLYNINFYKKFRCKKCGLVFIVPLNLEKIVCACSRHLHENPLFIAINDLELIDVFSKAEKIGKIKK